MRKISRLVLVVWALMSAGAYAQQQQQNPPQPSPKVVAVSLPPGQKVPRLNAPLDIVFDKLDGIDVSKLTLCLNGYAMPELPRERCCGGNRVRFFLQREPEVPSGTTNKTKQAWTSILGGPTAQFINVDVALRNGEAVVPGTARIRFQVFVKWVAVFWLIVVLVMIAVFVIAAMNTNIIRDTVPPAPPQGKKRPYSLARTQMAWWFLIIIGSFIFIFALTQDWRTINDEALILMGIGVGAALGGTMIEVTKQNTAASSLADAVKAQATAAADVALQTTKLQNLQAAAQPDPQAIATAQTYLAVKQGALAKANADLAAAQAAATTALSSPVSESFFDDLLTDANGANVHRFQMVGWTVVLGVIYLYGVWKLLALPDFNATLNALLGISAGTYLGFKIPEKQQ